MNREKSDPFFRAAVATGVFASCLNCEHWGNNAHADENATLNPDAGCANENFELPPPEIIVYGCKGWELAIPF